MAQHPSIVDLASCYLADEVPADEFCREFERWWHSERGELSQPDLAAASKLLDSVAGYAKEGELCAPATRDDNERALRFAVLTFFDQLTGGSAAG